MKPDINNYKTELQEWLTKYHHENLQLLEEVGAGNQLADLWVNGDWTATNQILGTIGKEHASRNILNILNKENLTHQQLTQNIINKGENELEYIGGDLLTALMKIGSTTQGTTLEDKIIIMKIGSANGYIDILNKLNQLSNTNNTIYTDKIIKIIHNKNKPTPDSKYYLEGKYAFKHILYVLQLMEERFDLNTQEFRDKVIDLMGEFSRTYHHTTHS